MAFFWSGLLALSFLASLCEPAFARERVPSSRTSKIVIGYIAPKNPDHQVIYERLKERRFLEQLQEFLSPLRLPRKLTLTFEGCDGVSNAWYEDRKVTVCYEYIADVVQNAPKETTPNGITPQDAIAGPAIEVFLHEVGHALFDMLKLPILGREEDAADQIAAYVLVQLDKEEARRTIAGVAYMLHREGKDQSTKMKDFADVHGLPAQRFFNLLCIAYGAHPEMFADVVKKEFLPTARAEGCAEEYEQVAYAVRKLIRPHVDQGKRARMAAKKWLRPN